MSNANHRAAFANDPRFMARIQSQLGTPAGGNRQKLPPQPTEAEPRKKESAATKRCRKVGEQNKESRLDTLVFDPEAGTLTATLAGAALLSYNTMLRMHDAKATMLKRTWQKRIEALRYSYPAIFNQWREAATYPLVVEEVYITGEAQCLDNESVCAACKPIIDAFVRTGFLPDDDPKHIAHPLPYTRRGANSGIIICFRPVARPWGLIDQSTIDRASEIPSLEPRKAE